MFPSRLSAALCDPCMHPHKSGIFSPGMMTSSQLELSVEMDSFQRRFSMLQAGSGDAGWESCSSIVVGVKLDGCHLALQRANNASLPRTSFIVSSSFENIVVAIYKVGC